MLNREQITKKLYDQAEIFKDCMMKKEYLKAVLCADRASMVAMCLDVIDAPVHSFYILLFIYQSCYGIFLIPHSEKLCSDVIPHVQTHCHH